MTENLLKAGFPDRPLFYSSDFLHAKFISNKNMFFSLYMLILAVKNQTLVDLKISLLSSSAEISRIHIFTILRY